DKGRQGAEDSVGPIRLDVPWGAGVEIEPDGVGPEVRRLHGVVHIRDPANLDPQRQRHEPSRKDANLPQASSASTTLPCTSVRRKSRPWNLNVSRLWSIP